MLKKKLIILFFLILFNYPFSFSTSYQTKSYQITKINNTKIELNQSCDFEIKKAERNFNNLVITIEILPGYVLIEPILYWDGSYLKSYPPQVNFHLYIKGLKRDSKSAKAETKVLFFNIDNFKKIKINLYNQNIFFKSLDYINFN